MALRHNKIKSLGQAIGSSFPPSTYTFLHVHFSLPPPFFPYQSVYLVHLPSNSHCKARGHISAALQCRGHGGVGQGHMPCTVSCMDCLCMCLLETDIAESAILKFQWWLDQKRNYVIIIIRYTPLFILGQHKPLTETIKMLYFIRFGEVPQMY